MSIRNMTRSTDPTAETNTPQTTTLAIGDQATQNVMIKVQDEDVRARAHAHENDDLAMMIDTTGAINSQVHIAQIV